MTTSRTASVAADAVGAFNVRLLLYAGQQDGSGRHTRFSVNARQQSEQITRQAMPFIGMRCNGPLPSLKCASWTCVGRS